MVYSGVLPGHTAAQLVKPIIRWRSVFQLGTSSCDLSSCRPADHEANGETESEEERNEPAVPPEAQAGPAALRQAHQVHYSQQSEESTAPAATVVTIHF